MIEILKNIQWNDVVSIFANIGTFVASLIAIFTLFEVKKQRQSMYKPELFISPFTLKVYNNPFFSKGLMEYEIGGYYHAEKCDDIKVKSSILPYYQIVNLGFGSARNVECVWQFDLKNALKMIIQYLPKGMEQYDCSVGEKQHFTAFSWEERSVHVFFPEKWDNVRNRDFVLPVSEEKDKKLEVIPSEIINAFMYYVMLKHGMYNDRIDNFFIESFEKFPTLRVKIRYNDLNGKRMQKGFVLKPTFNMNSVSESVDCSRNDVGVLFFEVLT